MKKSRRSRQKEEEETIG